MSTRTEPKIASNDFAKQTRAHAARSAFPKDDAGDQMELLNRLWAEAEAAVHSRLPMVVPPSNTTRPVKRPTFHED